MEFFVNWILRNIPRDRLKEEYEKALPPRYLVFVKHNGELNFLNEYNNINGGLEAAISAALEDGDEIVVLDRIGDGEKVECKGEPLYKVSNGPNEED